MIRKKLKNRMGMPLWILSCSLLLLAGILLLARSTAASGGIAAQDSGSANPDQVMIQNLQNALNSSKLSDADRQSLQKKLALNERLAAQRSGQSEAHGPKEAGSPVPMPAQQLIAPAVSGNDQASIIEGSESFVHPWEASINNMWQGSFNGLYYQVLAGASADDREQGLVIVIENQPEQSQRVQHTYLAPAHSGNLRLIERQGSRLKCSTPDGSTLYFDITTRSFQP